MLLNGSKLPMGRVVREEKRRKFKTRYGERESIYTGDKVYIMFKECP